MKQFFMILSFFLLVFYQLSASSLNERNKRQQGAWTQVSLSNQQQRSHHQQWYQQQRKQQQYTPPGLNHATLHSWPCYSLRNPGRAKFPFNVFFTESDRCNGDYRCANTRDERYCPEKCAASMYNEQAFLRGCRQSHERWQFDGRLGKCVFFVYGGCTRQQNLFLSKAECELECLSGYNTQQNFQQPASVNNLHQQQEMSLGAVPEEEVTLYEDNETMSRGGFGEEDGDDGSEFEIAYSAVLAGKYLCDSTISDPMERQFFNETDKCNGQYICENGADERSCPSKCYGFRYPDDQELLDCKASIPRWYYDTNRLKCFHFNYGGCADVINMFLTKQECMTECRGISTTDAFSPVLPPQASMRGLHEDDRTVDVVPEPISTIKSSDDVNAVVQEANQVVDEIKPSSANIKENEIVVGLLEDENTVVTIGNNGAQEIVPAEEANIKEDPAATF